MRKHLLSILMFTFRFSLYRVGPPHTIYKVYELMFYDNLNIFKKIVVFGLFNLENGHAMPKMEIKIWDLFIWVPNTLAFIESTHFFLFIPYMTLYFSAQPLYEISTNTLLG